MLLDIQQSPEGRSDELKINREMGVLHSGSHPTLIQPVGAKASPLQLAVLP